MHNRALHCPTLKPPDPIAIRPLQPEDAPQLAEFLSRLSDETRYLRFLTIIRRFTPEQLKQLTQLRPIWKDLVAGDFLIWSIAEKNQLH